MLLSRVVKTSRATTLQKKNTISQPRLNADADDLCTTGGSGAACTGLGVAFGPGEKSLERGAAVGAGSWGGRWSWRQPLGRRCVRLVLRVWEAFWQVTRLVHDVGLRVPANDIICILIIVLLHASHGQMWKIISTNAFLARPL